VTKDLNDKEKPSVDHGAYVVDVVEGGPADDAGIKEKDVIVSFDGEKIENSNDLIRAVRRAKPKSEVKIEVVRKDGHKVLTATIGRDSAPQAFAYSFGNGRMHVPNPPKLFRAFGMSELDGLSTEDLTKQLADYFEVPNKRGVLVTEVEPGSSGEKAGFKAGDVIVKADGSAIRRGDDLREQLDESKGREISIDIIRKGKPVSLTMKVEREDESDADDEDDASLNMVFPDDHHFDGFDFNSNSHDITRRALDRLRESLRELKNELKNELKQELQDIHQSVRTRFSHL
jgi:serine protease Do